MEDFGIKLWHALVIAAGMFWNVGWSLVLGFILSGLIQALISRDRMRDLLGRDGIREIAIATGFGAASSSCSYASAAISRTLFKKGAALVPSLAFLFASTNLVLELGIVLWLMLGWQFTAAEWLGGIVLIAVMTVLIRLTYPRHLVEEAREHKEDSAGHEHSSMPVAGKTLWKQLRNPETPVRVAQTVAMDASMLWKDIAGGFLIAGCLSAFVPPATLFLTGTSAWIQAPANAVAGPILAMLTFICSIGNIPLAAILWASGISFGGVLSFLYADLIVLPLLDVYRRYYGWKIAAYIFTVFFATMVIAGLAVDVAFTVLGLVPKPGADIRAHVSSFSVNYTFWLNLVFGIAALWIWRLNRSHPMHHHH
jgi:uncharacterized membrane protein YraQ (UPF0718 family)